MVAKAGFHALLVAALLLLSAALHAEEPVKNAAYQAQLSVLSNDNNSVTVKAVFLNLTYFSKADMGKAKQAQAAGGNQPPYTGSPPAIPAMPQTSEENHSYRADPLQYAPIYFFLEGSNVSSDGSGPACNPIMTDESGKATCKINYYYNGTDFAEVSKKKGCGVVQVIYYGETKGGIEFKRATENFLACPESGSALSSLGFIIWDALNTSNNMAFCFPAILIAGLLITSMYYSGRDPLSLFDLTTPRLPKTKQARVSGGSTSMAIRTAVSRYVQAKEKSRKSVGKMVAKAAARTGADKRAAKKEIKAFFKNLDSEMSKMVLKADASEADVERVWANQQGSLLSIFSRYGMNDRKETNKHLRKYFSKAMEDVHTYSAMEVAMRTMQTARSPYGGRVFNKINAWQQKTTEKLVRMEEQVMKAPFRRFLAITPLGLPFSIAAIPHKLIDMAAQYRSAKGHIRGTRRKAFGHLFSKVLTKQNKETGERESRATGRAFKSAIGATGIAKAAKWMYGWNYDGYVKNHSILAKKIGHLNDTQSKYVWDIAEALGISPYMVFSLLRTDEKTGKALEEWNNIKAAEAKAQRTVYSRQHLVEEMEAGLRTGTLKQVIEQKQREISSMFASNQEKREQLLQHLEVLKAYALNKDASLSVLFRAMITAKGIDASGDIDGQLRLIGVLENKLRHEFGIMRLKEEMLKNDKFEANMKFGRFVAFDRKTLGDWSRGEIDAVFQLDLQIARLARNNGLSDKELEDMARRRVSNPSNNAEVARKLAELRLLSMHEQVALKQGLTEQQVRDRIAWMRANGMDRKLTDSMTSADIGDYKSRDDVRESAAQRLAARIRQSLAGCEAVEETLRAKGARFLLDLGDEKGYKKDEAENVFNERMGFRLQQAIIREMDREVNARGEIVRGGVLSEFTGALASLNRLVARKAGTDDSISEIVIGSDPAGSVLAYHFKQICSALGINTKGALGKEMMSIESINDFELLFAKGIQRNQLSGEITRMFEQYLAAAGDSPNARRAAAARIASILHIEGTGAEVMAHNENLAKELLAIADTRRTLGERLSNLRSSSPSDYARVCKFLGLTAHLEHGGANDALDRMALERMSLLEQRGKWHSPKRREMNAIKGMLRITDDEMLSNTSYTNYLFGHMLEKTENTLHKWGGEMLRTGDKLNNGFSEWLSPARLSDARSAFKDNIDVSQRMEYAATRKAFLFNQYAGESSQHFETLLYVSRAMNRGAEFAISKGMGVVNAAGSLLGAYATQTEYTLHAYAMQKVFYKNLVNEESEYYDRKFATHMAEVKKNAKAQGKLEDYDGHAAIELKRRGMIFMDAKRGVPYIVSADNSGIVPIFEFNEGQLQNYWDKNARGIIVKRADKNGGKADVRDYGTLLSTLKVSDFGSEVIGVVAARNPNKNDPSHPHFERINPNELPSVQQLFEAAKINIPHRSAIAKVIAGVGATGGGVDADQKPLLHFVNGKSYVDHFAKAEFTWKAAPEFFKLGETKAYQRAMAKVGESFYDIFYDDTVRLRSWYAAQARARQAIDRQSNAMSDFMTIGTKRLDANMFFKEHQEDDNLKKFNQVLEAIDNDRQKALDNGAENAKKNRVKETLEDMVGKLSNNDKSATFLRRIYAYADKDTATLQSVAYGAEKSMEAIKAMYKAGNLSKEEYSRLYSAAKDAANGYQQAYKRSQAENYDFTKAVIGIMGSHDWGTYYGSARNIFTFLIPTQNFHLVQNYRTGFGMSIESTAMRDGAYNRGGRRGADSFEKMNMNTGQGIYENQRWWATSLYEQEMVLPMAFSLYVHKSLLPFASHVYRRMIGLSSPLQRTELETEWGKPSYPIHAFFGLKRGINDNIAASAQMLQDYSGGSIVIAALRKGGKVVVDAEGNVGVQRSGMANKLDSWAVDSPWVMSDAQIKYLNRPQDRMKALEALGDSTVKEGRTTIYVTPEGELVSGREADKKEDKPLVVKELYNMVALAQEQADSASDQEAKSRLRRYEKLLEPYITVQLKDEQQDSVKISDGGGHYFNIDGSRRRPWEIFMGDHVNTASQVIPGMTEYGPWMSKTLSPTTVNYFEHWGSTFSDSAQAVGLQVIKNGTLYSNLDEESGIYIRKAGYDTHRDSYRDVFRMETPAALHIMKFQSYAIMYDGILPIVGLTKGLLRMPLNIATLGYYDKYAHRREAAHREHEFKGDADAAKIDAQLSLHGLGTMREINDSVSFKQSGYSELQQARDSMQRNWFWQRWGGKLYENYLHRSEVLALQSDEHRRNMKVFLRQQLLMSM